MRFEVLTGVTMKITVTNVSQEPVASIYKI
jgi:hypothetical protein